MNRKALLTIASALAAATLVAPVQSQDIVVTSERSLDRFVEDVSANLDSELERAHIPLRSDPNGYAIVRFECGADGKPRNVTLFRRARDADVNRMARQAVGRLSSLHPLPRDLRDGQVIQANVVIARSEDHYQRLAAELSRSEAKRIASSESERRVVALRAGALTAS